MNKPTIPEVLPLIKEYLEKDSNSAGGSLHILIEDGNTRDSDIEFCIEWAKSKGDEDGIKLGEILLSMSRTQRGKIASLSQAFY